MIESQLNVVLGALRHMRAESLATVDARAEAEASFLRDVEKKMRGTVWVAGGCDSYYLDATGRNSTHVARLHLRLPLSVPLPARGLRAHQARAASDGDGRARHRAADRAHGALRRKDGGGCVSRSGKQSRASSTALHTSRSACASESSL